MDVDVAIVGAGFAGLGMGLQLARHGRPSFCILESAAEPGGIWRDNAYPGCACDIPSMLYSYSFVPHRDWTRSYPARDEIWEYLRHCAALPELAGKIRYGSELTAARYDDERTSWTLEVAGGAPVRARVLILAMGALNRPNVPAIPGLERFAGRAFHSSQWDASAPVRDADVAVVGTGASAVQIVPAIAPLARRLTLYQRTPAWILPRGDRPVGSLQRWLRAHVPGVSRATRGAIYQGLELRGYGFVRNPGMLDLAEKLARRHLASQVRDEELRAKLTPPYRLGCKRVLLSDDFYPALERPNVELVTEPVARIDEHAVVTASGVSRPAQTIVFATGFRASEGVGSAAIYGRGGRALDDVWSGGMQAYLGTAIAGFPNLFTLIGPNTGLGHNSMVLMMEAQYAYVLDALALMERRGARAMEVRAAAQDAYNERLGRRLARTVWNSGCRSWYLDARGKNTTMWPGLVGEFARATRRVDPQAYELSRGPT